jgi:hypothetical protein
LVSGGTENGCAFLRDGYCSDGFFEAGVGVRIGRRTRLYRRGDREIEGYVELLGEISGCEKGELCGGSGDLWFAVAIGFVLGFIIIVDRDCWRRGCGGMMVFSRWRNRCNW